MKKMLSIKKFVSSLPPRATTSVLQSDDIKNKIENKQNIFQY